MPKLSIITINYNNASGLQKTIESVFAQTFTDYEYIIIDGGSTDGSKEYIETFVDKLSYWVSEEDRGVYHAMNKGIIASNGNFLLFLNSGDYLFSNLSLKILMQYSNEYFIVYGDVLFEGEKGRKEWKSPDYLSFKHFSISNLTLPHPATIISKEIFEKIGHYNEHFKIVSDWELFAIAINKFNYSYKHINQFIAVVEDNGISRNSTNLRLIQKEKCESLQKHFPMFLADYKEYHEKSIRLQNIVARRIFKLWNIIRRIFHLQKL